MIDLFAKAEIDAVYLFGNEFKSVMSSHLSAKRLLPIEVPKTAETVDYIYEQPPRRTAGLVASALHRGADLSRALLESVAAEHAARMTAMDAASSNASEMIDKLTLAHESRAPGEHHPQYRDRQRRGRIGLKRIFMITGKVIQVAGPAVDIEFPEGQIPVIRTAIRITSAGFDEPEPINIICEWRSHREAGAHHRAAAD